MNWIIATGEERQIIDAPPVYGVALSVPANCFLYNYDLLEYVTEKLGYAPLVQDDGGLIIKNVNLE